MAIPRSPRPKSGKSSRTAPGTQKRLQRLQRLQRLEDALTDHAEAIQRLNRANVNLASHLESVEMLPGRVRQIEEMLEVHRERMYQTADHLATFLDRPWYRRLFGRPA